MSDVMHCAVKGCHNLSCVDGYCLRCNEEIAAMGLWYQQQEAKEMRKYGWWMRLLGKVGLA